MKMKRFVTSVGCKIWPVLIIALLSSFAFGTLTPEPTDRTIVDIHTIELANSSVQFSWSPVPGATGYKIYQSEDPSPLFPGTWKPLARVANTGYTATAIARKQFYRVTWDDIPASSVGFALMEGGTLHNGNSNVTISTFYMSRSEVTQAEYLAVTGINPSSHPLGYGIGPNFPVWNVSWFDAVRFCNLRSIQEGITPCYSYAGYGTNPADWPADWTVEVMYMRQNVFCDWTANGYRLPTEMEWQFAARGGIYSHDYPFSGSDNIDLVGWYWGNWGSSWYTPHSVNALSPNEIGIYDLSGNLWEWVWDIPANYPATPQTDPHGPTSLYYQRALRGGAWNVGNPGTQCSVSYRNWSYADAPSSSLGFRVCRIAP